VLCTDSVASAIETNRRARLDVVELEVKSHRGRIVGPVSLSLTQGECVVLSGQMGVGKSLVSEHLAGLERPGLTYSGRLLLDAEASSRGAGGVALAPQDWRLGGLRTDRVEAVLAGRNPEVLGWLARLELDLGRIRHLDLVALGAAERMRLFLACALGDEAPVIVVDGLGDVLEPRLCAAAVDAMEAAALAGRMLIVTARDEAPWAGSAWRRVQLGAEVGSEPVAVPLVAKRKEAVKVTATPPVLDVSELDVERHRRRLFTRHKPALAVDGASLFVRKGEILVLLGPSGSGKSTLLAAMAGFLPPRAGRIRVSGVDVTLGRGRQVDLARNRVRLVSTELARTLDPSHTVGELLVRAEPKRDPTEWLDRLGLPQHLAGVAADSLSEGEAFRVALGLALCGAPQVILLDAPRSGAVNADGGTLTSLLLAEKAQGKSFVLATSDPGISRSIADRIAILDAGRIVEFGPTSLVLGKPAHPRTLGLLRAEPGPEHDPRSPRIGCHLAGACPREVEQCLGERPALDFVPGTTRNHRVACFSPNLDVLSP
jgi:ABC-type glutathione transport system ATPase component